MIEQEMSFSNDWRQDILYTKKKSRSSSRGSNFRNRFHGSRCVETGPEGYSWTGGTVRDKSGSRVDSIWSKWNGSGVVQCPQLCTFERWTVERLNETRVSTRPEEPEMNDPGVSCFTPRRGERNSELKRSMWRDTE